MESLPTIVVNLFRALYDLYRYMHGGKDVIPPPDRK